MCTHAGYPFDVPPPRSSLPAYLALSYHLPLLIAFSVAHDAAFVWGGCMLLRMKHLRPGDPSGLLKVRERGAGTGAALESGGGVEPFRLRLRNGEGGAPLPRGSAEAWPWVVGHVHGRLVARPSEFTSCRCVYKRLCPHGPRCPCSLPGAIQHAGSAAPTAPPVALLHGPRCPPPRCNQVQAWRSGGYSDDLILASFCTGQGLRIRTPSFAIFPQRYAERGVRACVRGRGAPCVMSRCPHEPPSCCQGPVGGAVHRSVACCVGACVLCVPTYLPACCGA